MNATGRKHTVQHIRMVVPGQVDVIADIVHSAHEVVMHKLLIRGKFLTHRHRMVHVLRHGVHRARLFGIGQIIHNGKALIDAQILLGIILLTVIQVVIRRVVRGAEHLIVEILRLLRRGYDVRLLLIIGLLCRLRGYHGSGGLILLLRGKVETAQPAAANTTASRGTARCAHAACTASTAHCNTSIRFCRFFFGADSRLEFFLKCCNVKNVSLTPGGHLAIEDDLRGL